ncbi:MAG TPA: hypothetical protein VGD60_11145 [Candidatus Acidoferrales bacterium]
MTPLVVRYGKQRKKRNQNNHDHLEHSDNLIRPAPVGLPVELLLNIFPQRSLRIYRFDFH